MPDTYRDYFRPLEVALERFEAQRNLGLLTASQEIDGIIEILRGVIATVYGTRDSAAQSAASHSTPQFVDPTGGR
jgi:hypothetical protein